MQKKVFMKSINDDIFWFLQNFFKSIDRIVHHSTIEYQFLSIYSTLCLFLSKFLYFIQFFVYLLLTSITFWSKEKNYIDSSPLRGSTKQKCVYWMKQRERDLRHLKIWCKISHPEKISECENVMDYYSIELSYFWVDWKPPMQISLNDHHYHRFLFETRHFFLHRSSYVF